MATFFFQYMLVGRVRGTSFPFPGLTIWHFTGQHYGWNAEFFSGEVVARMDRYKEYYCVCIRVTLCARPVVCSDMNASSERWGACDARGKFRPIHSDDWKETGQENQMSVAAASPPFLFTAFECLATLCAYWNTYNVKQVETRVSQIYFYWKLFLTCVFLLDKSFVRAFFHVTNVILFYIILSSTGWQVTEKCGDTPSFLSVETSVNLT